MNKRTTEWIVGGSAALLIAWMLYHIYSAGSSASASAPLEIPGSVQASSPAITLNASTPAPATPNACTCGTDSCAITTAQIPTLQQIMYAGVAAANQIYAAGNATLQAVANTNQNQLVQVTVG